MRQGLGIGSILLLLASGVTAEESGVKLENRFVPGDTSIYEWTVNGTGTATVKGVAALSGQDLTLPLGLTGQSALRCQVVAVNEEGSGDLALTLDRLSATATGFYQTLSAEVSPDRVSVLYNMQEVAPREAVDWVKKPLIITLGRNGQVLAMQGELLEALRQQPAGVAEWGSLIPQLAGLRPPFPEEPIFPGESLEQHREISLPGLAQPMAITARFTFQGTETVQETPCATIGVEAQVSLRDFAFQLPVPSTPQTTLALTVPQVTGKVNMVLHLALADAKLRRAEVTSDWRATLTGPLPPPLGRGENITVEIQFRETADASLKL